VREFIVGIVIGAVISFILTGMMLDTHNIEIGNANKACKNIQGVLISFDYFTATCRVGDVTVKVDNN
jgi:predicted small secreted protein